MPAAYDLFLSYKSENVDVARAVAERLIASGLRVWFAEYKILLVNYDEFQEEIDAGIDASRWALVFTNDRWADSPYCKLEIQRITRVMGRERTLEVCIPSAEKPHAQSPWLADVPRMEYQKDPDAVVRFVADHTGLAVDSYHPTGPLRSGNRAFQAQRRFGLELDTGPFRPVAATQANWAAMAGEPGFLGLYKAQLDGADVTLGLQVYPFQNATASLSIGEEGTSDDRHVYRLYQRYAREWCEGQKADPRGLHLFFWQERSHMALTYLLPGQGGGRAWERRYVFTFPPAKGEKPGELDLIFNVTLPEQDPDRALAAFCRLAPYFDAIASSLGYDRRSVHADPAHWAMLGAKAAYTALALWLAVRTSGGTPKPALLGAVWALAGFAGADLLLTGLMPKVSRAIRSSQRTTADKLEGSVSAAQRVSADLVDWLLGTPILYCFVLVFGVLDWLGCAAVAAGLFARTALPAFWVLAGAVVGARGLAAFTDRARHPALRAQDAASGMPGAPKMKMDALLAELSPHLPALVADVHRGERRPKTYARVLLCICLLSAGALVAFGRTQAKWLWPPVAVAVLSVAAYVHYRRTSVPPLVREAVAGGDVKDAARKYYALGSEGGQPAYLARASLWAARLCQLTAGEWPWRGAEGAGEARLTADQWEAVILLGRTVSELANAMAMRPGGFSKDQVNRAAEAATDILRKAAAYAPDAEARDRSEFALRALETSRSTGWPQR